MRQQTDLRGCQIYGVAGRPIKQIAAWIKAKSGEPELLDALLDTGLPRPLTRTIRWIVWFKLTMSTGAAIQSAAPAMRQSSIHGCLGPHTTSIGTSVRRLTKRVVLVPAAGARLKSRTITSGLLRLIKSKNGLGPSPADRVRVSRLLHLPVSINLHAPTIWS
jgi:hypothetical protein